MIITPGGGRARGFLGEDIENLGYWRKPIELKVLDMKRAAGTQGYAMMLYKVSFPPSVSADRDRPVITRDKRLPWLSGRFDRWSDWHIEKWLALGLALIQKIIRTYEMIRSEIWKCSTNWLNRKLPNPII
jgi:hypothetical protein